MEFLPDVGAARPGATTTRNSLGSLYELSPGCFCK